MDEAGHAGSDWTLDVLHLSVSRLLVGSVLCSWSSWVLMVSVVALMSKHSSVSRSFFLFPNLKLIVIATFPGVQDTGTAPEGQAGVGGRMIAWYGRQKHVDLQERQLAGCSHQCVCSRDVQLTHPELGACTQEPKEGVWEKVHH